MEEHRLKTMADDYNKDLFNQLFKQTEKLRNKLSSEISLARFPGMESKDIRSWFQTKFLYAYQKYQPLYNDNPEILKANIISSLQRFKCRILRHAYSSDIDYILGTISLDNSIEQMDWVKEEEPNYTVEDVELVLNKLKEELNQDAFNILVAQIYPPDYILDRVTKKQINRIPSQILAEYFDMTVDDVTYHRKCIRKAISRLSKNPVEIKL